MSIKLLSYSDIKYTIVPFGAEFVKNNCMVSLYYKYVSKYPKISGCISDNKYTSMEYVLTTPYYDHWSIDCVKEYPYTSWFVIDSKPDKVMSILDGIVRKENVEVIDYDIVMYDGKILAVYTKAIST